MLDPKRKLFRWGPISAYQLFMDFTVSTSFAPMKQLLGICYPETIIIYADHKVTWLSDEGELVRQSEVFLKRHILKSQKRQDYLKLWRQRTSNLRSLFVEIDKTNLRELGFRQLHQHFKKFATVYADWWTLTMSVELVTTAAEPLLGEKLKRYYPNEKPHRYNQAFATLTSPLTLTFYRQEQLDLLHILNLSKDQQRAALAVHQKRFYWIYNSYLEAKVLPVTYFQEELEKLAGADHQALQNEIETYLTRIRQDKEKIIKTINPGRETQNLISIVETFASLQDERKMDNFRADHYLELFVQEFSRRTKHAVADLKLLLPEELGDSDKHYSQEQMNKRRQCFVSVCTEQNVANYDGDQAQAIARQFANVASIDESMIHGILASTGDTYYFRGTAKIIPTIADLDKLQDGEILVTTMTSPDFVIGMKRAGAIITDTGGILCHAAIVSRELKKPCIVGTQIATKVIRDGDVVELHCGRGTVKIIKHSR